MAQTSKPGVMAEEQLSISSQEERELRRVFDFLCDYHKKSVLRAKLRTPPKPTNNETEGQANTATSEAASAKAEEDALAVESENEHVLEELRALDRNPDRKIKAIDLAHAMKALGKPRPRKEIKNIVWEVDENLDGMVDWDEFQLMFMRNISDKTGLEPSGLFNLAQFMIYDQNHNGRVSVDETMNLLYARYGKSRMEVKLRELFGEEMQETGKDGGEINFVDYLTVVEKNQRKAFLATQEKSSAQK